MLRYFIKPAFLFLLAALVLHTPVALADDTACPPNCSQPSAETQARNNDILKQIDALLQEQAAIGDEISKYPHGAPPELMAKMEAIELKIEKLGAQVH